MLVLCTLAFSLHLHSTAIPKVLAQSSLCPPDSCTGGATRKVAEGGYTYDETCYGYPTCSWHRQTIDPIVVTNNNYCCLSNGHTARCALLRTGESCEPNALETDVQLFSTASNNQRACEIQRVNGVCNGVRSSSSQSSSAASCGNNVREASNDEECDWGGNNSDTLPNRCSKNCKFPTCGNSRVDDNFSDPVSGTTIAEECDNIEYDIEGVQYPSVSSELFTLNQHSYCASDCTVKESLGSLFFIIPRQVDQPVYFIRKIFDWNSIFFPLSSVSF